MKNHRLSHAVRPFISALAVIVTAAVLVFVIYFTELGRQWITFLTGILIAATLAEASRASYAEWIITRRTVQLSSIKNKLERETQLRKAAEKAVAANESKLHLIDEILPTMVALIDVEGHCRYCNRAFMNWLRLQPQQVNGRHMRDVLGVKVYNEIASSLRQSMDGHAAHYERVQKMQNGAVYRLSIEHIPQFGENGKTTGFYMLINDITGPGDVRASDQLSGHESNAAMSASVRAGKAQDMFVDSFSEQITGQQDASRIMTAIEKGEFRLFCQSIAPLPDGSAETGHYEILVRLMEEEEGMIPPGAFFPLAEKHGLMPHLDRWVVQHITEWSARQNPQGRQQGSPMSFINVSGATIIDPGFPEYLHLTLQEYGMPGSALCFEIEDSELSARTADVAEFARKVRECGCRVALSGFGRNKVLFDLIRGFQVEFLKIDGSVILDILHDPVKHARVTAINRVAKIIGVRTIAEFVENQETIAALKKIGIDYAQGFGIARPRPLPN